LAGLQESPATPGGARRPPLGSSTIDLVIAGRIARADIPALCDHVRGLLEGSGADVLRCDVGGLVEPDAVAVDALARLQLTARRCGRELRLLHPCDALRRLLALVGLGDVLPLDPASRLEPGRQAEEGEQAGGVEEEGDPGDPTV